MTKLRELKPISRRPEEADAIEAEIITTLKREFYAPLIKAVGVSSKALKNSKWDIIQALRAGKIAHSAGVFTGKFDAATSKELKAAGAVWDKKVKGWRIPLSLLHPDVASEVRASASKFKRMVEKLKERLDAVVPEDLAKAIDVDKLIDSAIYRSGQDFEANVKSIGVAPKLTPEQRARLIAEYRDNLSLSISDFTKSEIKKLRETVAETAQSGGRYESLVKGIQDSYGVSRNKAKFLARQETSLIMTKLAQVRYESAGVPEYRWQTVTGSPAHPVRPYHKKNDGKIFRWDSPPTVDEHGSRKNPGQDYNCRCRAIPVVRF